MLLLFQVGLLFSVCYAQLSCRPIDLQRASFCKTHFSNSRQVLSSWNETNENALASAAFDDRSGCSFYHSIEYLCEKHFPSCTGPNGTAVLLKMCRDSCFKAEELSGCSSFQQNYFDTECGGNQYFSDDTSRCLKPNLPNPESSNLMFLVYVGVPLLLLVGFFAGMKIRKKYCGSSKGKGLPSLFQRQDSQSEGSASPEDTHRSNTTPSQILLSVVGRRKKKGYANLSQVDSDSESDSSDEDFDFAALSDSVAANRIQLVSELESAADALVEHDTSQQHNNAQNQHS